MYTFDSRLIRPGDVFVALKGDTRDGHDFIPQALANGASRIIDGYEALDEEARAKRRRMKAKVIGVTGSAGKTTTKEFLRTFFSALGKTCATAGNFNNHIGLPLTILNADDDCDYLILEMGTNHPGEIAHLCSVASPDCAVITNIGTAHLEFFQTREGIAREKGELFRSAKEHCITISDTDFIPLLDYLASPKSVEYVSPLWGMDFSPFIEKVAPGPHNLANASLAFAMAVHYGLDIPKAVSALDNFSLPGERWKKCEQGGVLFIDDTYNANPDSMLAALDTFKRTPCLGRRIAVLGDMLELGFSSHDYHRLVFDRAKDCGFDAVFAVGSESSKCSSSRAFPDSKALYDFLRTFLKPGDAVLLKASHSIRLSLPKDFVL